MLQEITDRRSVREYQDRPVEQEKLELLLQSAMLAPSGHNTQPWHFITVSDPAKKRDIAKCAHNQSWMAGAPLYIVCVADGKSRLEDTAGLDFYEESPQFELKQIIRDCAIAVEHMVLTAQSIGLATCWVAWFTQRELRPLLGIPADKYVVAVLTVGYGAQQIAPRPRKQLSEALHKEMW